jgi:hypothetical protein
MCSTPFPRWSRKRWSRGTRIPSGLTTPRAIAETRRCIPGFEAVAERTTTTVGLYRGMLELHPDRVNQGALWGSATSAKG